MCSALRKCGCTVVPVEIRRDVAGAFVGRDPKTQVVFNWCEGLEGEPNGHPIVAQVLDSLGFTYTGADTWTLTITQDKQRTRQHLQSAGLPVPTGRVFKRPTASSWKQFPAIVKPMAEHCSFGITRESVVETPQELRTRIAYILDTFHQPALVEDFIDGAEFNVAIWGNDDPEVLPLSMIDYAVFDDFRDRLCSYDAKWDTDSSAYQLTMPICPAPIDEALRERIASVALAAYRALRCRDYGRIDIRVRDEVPYVLDVNANPDITIEGGLARSARAAGFDYGAMVAHIIGIALARRPLAAKPLPAAKPSVRKRSIVRTNVALGQIA
jgi:D-alanine-D-alanine ligase